MSDLGFVADFRRHGLEWRIQCLSPVWRHCHGDEDVSPQSLSSRDEPRN